MQLTIRDVAKFFRVSERTVYRWLEQKTIPAYKVNDQYRFDRSELLDWVSTRKIPVSKEFFATPDAECFPLPDLTEAIKSGGIYYRLEGSDKETIIRNMVDLMPLPPSLDREFLFRILLAREKLASTGVGEGIAVPHVRNPVILNIPEPVVIICFLENPVEFGALDGRPVFCLFGLISPTVRVHLHLMARIAFVLRGPQFRKLLSEQGSRGKILAALLRAESNFKPADAIADA